MRKYGFKHLACLFAFVAASATIAASAEKLVLLHTNDTHSQIEPTASGKGGILQLKAVIDSVRKAEKNVVLIDAGDMVQGSLYFKFFKGDLEFPLFNEMNYDIRILGNHEFDNGLDELAGHYKDVKGARLSANYDFSDTPLKGMFQPYVIKKIGGKKVGFFALNVDPNGIIAKDNIKGMKFKDILETANETAYELKHKKGCDVVVAVTHIGYTSDIDGATTDPILAANSKDIDIIIGGHSHTLLDPENPDPEKPYIINNADGKSVVVAQTGKYGYKLGKIEIDLNNPENIEYSLIPVTDRFPKEKLDKKMISLIEPFKHKVDSVNARVIAHSSNYLKSDDRNGGYANWAADYAKWYGDLVLDSLNYGRKTNVGFMNVGGIRMDMPEGDVTEGQILSTFPFSNRMTIIDIKGSDLLEALQASAFKGGEAISENVRVVVDEPTGKIKNVIIDNKPIDPDKDYLVTTIDYLAEGNDYLYTMANGKRIWTDDKDMSAPLMRYIVMTNNYGLPIAPDMNPRWIFTIPQENK